MKTHYQTLFSRPLIVSLAVVCGFFGSTVNASAKYDPFPHIRLAKKEYRGKEAINAIRPFRNEIAALHRMTPDQLEKLFQEDSTLRLNQQGLLFYHDNASLSDKSLPFQPSPDVIPEAETFKLHSRPGAKGGTIYLSFQGCTVTGTPWNNGTTPIEAKPYSMDADPAFSTAELREIRAIWLSVSEDYTPFDVDVTTEKPLNPILNKHIDVVITPSNEWFGNTAGGVAYVNNYTWGDAQQVCWVFSALLRNNTKYISEAASHEAGHTLSLNHWKLYNTTDGSFITEYYSGQGSWAPIMGVGYYRPITTWCKGEYNGAGIYGLGVLQDDIARIAAITGKIGDGAPSGISTITHLDRYYDTNQVMHIDQRWAASSGTDTDCFKINTLGGAMQLQVDPAAYAPNLDLRVRLLNSTGVKIMESNPPGIGKAIINTNSLVAGTYYLQITPVGEGDPKTTGYSSYGECGRYYVSGTYLPAQNDTNSAPQVAVYPTSNIIVGRPYTVYVTASDDLALRSVVVKANGKIIFSTNGLNVASAVFGCGATAPAYPTVLTLSATATDNQSASKTTSFTTPVMPNY